MAGERRPCYADGMLKWVLTLTVLAALLAAGAWYPIHGRTVLERWQAAAGPMEFAGRCASELKRGLGFGPAPRSTQAARTQRPAGSKGTAPARSVQPAQPAHPTERHTDEDRAALERLLVERARQ